MITTVTTAALSSTVTVTVASALGAATVLGLIIFLITKELTSAELENRKASPRLKFFTESLNVAILPLLLTFAVIVAVKVWEIL